jgi:hypothetical protein
MVQASSRGLSAGPEKRSVPPRPHPPIHQQQGALAAKPVVKLGTFLFHVKPAVGHEGFVADLDGFDGDSVLKVENSGTQARNQSGTILKRYEIKPLRAKLGQTLSSINRRSAVVYTIAQMRCTGSETLERCVTLAA